MDALSRLESKKIAYIIEISFKQFGTTTVYMVPEGYNFLDFGRQVIKEAEEKAILLIARQIANINTAA